MIEELPNIKALDIKKGLFSTQDNKALYIKLLKKFIKDQSNFESEFLSALEVNDTEYMIRLAHTLKGVAATLGATEIADVSKTLESTCVENESADVIKENLAVVTPPLKSLIDELNKLFDAAEVSTSQNQTQKELDKESALSILQEIMEMSENSDTEAIDMITKFKALSGVDTYSKELADVTDSLESYDFEEAIEFLEKLKKKIAD